MGERSAVAGDFGLTVSSAIKFDPRTMYIVGCTCAYCRDWKTKPDARQFWRWPSELTPELRHILGLQCFTFIKLAQAYRAAGFAIDTQAEAEQAFFLHRNLGFWFQHGAGWLDAAQEDVRQVYAAIANRPRKPTC